jgi:hypothetical protein
MPGLSPRNLILEVLLEVLGRATLNVAMDIVFVDLTAAILAMAAVAAMVLCAGYAWNRIE